MAVTKGQGQGRRQPAKMWLAGVWARIASVHPRVIGIAARRRAQLTIGLALAITLTNTLGLLASSQVPGTEWSRLILSILTVACLASYVLGRTRLYLAGSILMPAAMSASAYALVLAGSKDPSSSLYSSIPAALVIGGALLPLGGQAALTVANVLATALLPVVVSGMTMGIAGRDAGVVFSVGALVVVITAFRDALERTRLGELRAANEELTGMQATLEQRVVERTAEWERRSAYLGASAEVGRVAGSILDGERLIREVVELIRQRFGLYYVGLFTVDAAHEASAGLAGRWAVLRAGTGEAGAAMLARGHRLQVGGGSMVGWCISNGQARVALEANEDAVRMATPELPDTRSEAALPLRSRGNVIGALTVQSEQSGAFDGDALAALQVMADQVATALDNARLFAESNAALERERRAYGELGRQAWQQLLRVHGDRGYGYVDKSIAPVEGDWLPEMVEAAQTGSIAEGRGLGERTLAIPLQVRDQVIGVVHVSQGDGDGAWTGEEAAILSTMAEQIGLALDSARLYEDTQRRATGEQMLSRVTANLARSLDVDTILQTVVRELGQSLSADEVSVLVGPQHWTSPEDQKKDSSMQTGSAKARPFAVEDRA